MSGISALDSIRMYVAKTFLWQKRIEHVKPRSAIWTRVQQIFFFFDYLLCVVHVYIFGVFIICPSIDSPVFRVCYFILNQIQLQDARHSTSTENWFYCFLSVFWKRSDSFIITYIFICRWMCVRASQCAWVCCWCVATHMIYQQLRW